MQQAAENLVGEHDFRNFCKVDGSKQIENHRRGVISATISQDGEDCVFELIGTAFLWHQVRHIMGVLLLVGSGLEPPAVVKALLNTSLSPVDVSTDLASAETIDGKPLYQMASALPLQLYRCNYNDGDVDWRYGGYDGPYEPLSDRDKLAAEASSQSAVMGLLQSLKTEAIEANMRARHIQQFYDEAAGIYSSALANPQMLGDSSSRARINATLYSVGSGEVLSTKNYVPLLQRARTETPDEINRKWREGGGARRNLRKAAEQLSLETPED
jgi:tRNA pseudouridine38/39 synthase